MDTNDLRQTSTENTYDQHARRQSELLAFVENVCNVLIVERFDVELRPRPWQLFDGDVEEMFDPFSRFQMLPDAEFDLTNGEFPFARFASLDSARYGTQAGCGSPHEVRAPFEPHRTDRPLTPTVSTTLSRGSPETSPLHERCGGFSSRPLRLCVSAGNRSFLPQSREDAKTQRRRKATTRLEFQGRIAHRKYLGIHRSLTIDLGPSGRNTTVRECVPIPHAVIDL